MVGGSIFSIRRGRVAGVIGGIGGANCRTVAAHAVHNGLTHLTEAHDILHGEKVAYGILVQLRLEEMIQGNKWRNGLLGSRKRGGVIRLDTNRRFWGGNGNWQIRSTVR